jgi:aerobic C4-dicarboxylate transport protein
VATLVVSKWCGELDTAQLDKELAQGAIPQQTTPIATAATVEVQHG